MKRRMALSALVALTSGLVAAGWVAAQSGTRSTAQPSRVAPQAPFEERLWSYLREAQYRNWAPMPGQSGDAYAGNSPHGERVKLFVNRTAAGRPTELPSGSILIKENYDPTGERLMAVTVMYRSKGYSPDDGDWHWTKYEADGKVALMDGQRIAGRVSMCVECHKSAAGGDYVFANDPQ